MEHKGVTFSINREVAEPDIWRYNFQIGPGTRRGKVRARLELLAIRRVQLYIDRELKRLEKA